MGRLGQEETHILEDPIPRAAEVEAAEVEAAEVDMGLKNCMTATVQSYPMYPPQEEKEELRNPDEVPREQIIQA